MNNKVIIYARTASINQNTEESCSIQTQISRCKQYAENKNLNIIGIFNDSGSSKYSNLRKSIVAFALQNDIPYILVASYDRWSRDIAEVERLKENDIEIITTNIDDLILFKHTKVISEVNRQRRSNTVQEGFIHARLSNEKTDNYKNFRKSRLYIL